MSDPLAEFAKALQQASADFLRAVQPEPEPEPERYDWRAGDTILDHIIARCYQRDHMGNWWPARQGGGPPLSDSYVTELARLGRQHVLRYQAGESS